MLEVADIFANAKIVQRTAFLNKITDHEFAIEMGVPGVTLEGYLFPDTYKLRPDTAPETLARMLVKRHQAVFAELKERYAVQLANLEQDLGFSDTEIVTLASIVEKETGQAHERPKIAQVFINRLLDPKFQPKLLQTDPTIIYGCLVAPLFLKRTSDACQLFEDRIRRIHLVDGENIFNTYKHPGLPPGPISNPGRYALEAVMNPDGSDALFFVSKNDGTHKFSRTKAEHDAAVIKFQRNGKAFGPSKDGAKRPPKGPRKRKLKGNKGLKRPRPRKADPFREG